MTVLELLRGVAERFPDARAMASQTPQGDWSYRTFSELDEEVNLVARAFCKLGLQEYHSVLVIGTNSAEWSVATLAAIAAGGIATSLYEHSHVDQIHFTADHSRADIIVVDSGALLERVMEVRPQRRFFSSAMIF
jgi:long-chain-fatty-acid--CoA ligase ACSBG